MTDGNIKQSVHSFPTINVFAKDKRVGTLIFEQPRVCQFQYDEQWQKNGYAISPHIPIAETAESSAIVNFIRNLFPEGSAFEVLLESENLSTNNLYGLLKTIGHDTAGMLTFSEQTSIQQATQLRKVTEQELISRLDSGIPANIANWDGKYRLSIAGVQNKLNVYLNKENSIYLADGDLASNHILKFASGQHPSIVVNELFCMRLAKAVGIDVAEVRNRNFGQHHALMVKRFDRHTTEQGVDKRHIIDGCQALNLSPEYKYEQNFGSSADVVHIRDGANLTQLFNFAHQCAVPAVAIQKLIDWLVFNLIIGNSDAHGKNVSFYILKRGITLTPFYDLVSVVYEAQNQTNLDVNLAMAIGDNFNINQITAFDLLSFAEEVDIKFDILKRRIDRLTNQCLNQVHSLDFADDQLTKEQQTDVKAIERLITQRCELLQKQSQQFNSVIQSAFS